MPGATEIEWPENQKKLKKQKQQTKTTKKQTHGLELADSDDGLCFFGFLGVYEQKKQQTHGPELADADVVLCFCFLFCFCCVFVFLLKKTQPPGI